MQVHMPPEIIDLDLIDQTTSYQDLLRNESSKLPQPIADKPVEQCFSNQVESYQVVNSLHQKGERDVAVNSSEEISVQQAEGENQGIDLNKTPPPKPRKRKYTPEVIREWKPARTPKTATPKPPKTAENSSGKRKYVRKNKDANPQDTPSKPQEMSSKPVETASSELGEIVDQDSRSRNMPLRRSLNFDLEDSQAVDQLSGSGLTMFRTNSLETQGPVAHAGAETVVSSQTSLAMHCSQGQGTVVMENSVGSDVRFDLNSSTNQVVNENVRIPQTPNQPPQPSRLDLLKAKWKANFEIMVKNMNQSQKFARREGENLNQPPQPSRLDLLKAKWKADFEITVKNMNQSQKFARREGENLNQPPQPSRLDLLKAKWKANFEITVKNMNQSQKSARREGENLNQPPQPSRLDPLKAKWKANFEIMVKNMNQSQKSARREGENLKKLTRMMNCQNVPGNHGRHLQDGQNRTDLLNRSSRRPVDTTLDGGIQCRSYDHYLSS